MHRRWSCRPSPGAEMITFLAPALKVAEAFLAGEDAGAFGRNIDAHGGVRQDGRVRSAVT